VSPPRLNPPSRIRSTHSRSPTEVPARAAAPCLQESVSRPPRFAHSPWRPRRYWPSGLRPPNDRDAMSAINLIPVAELCQFSSIKITRSGSPSRQMPTCDAVVSTTASRARSGWVEPQFFVLFEKPLGDTPDLASPRPQAPQCFRCDAVRGPVRAVDYNSKPARRIWPCWKRGFDPALPIPKTPVIRSVWHDRFCRRGSISYAPAIKGFDLCLKPHRQLEPVGAAKKLDTIIRPPDCVDWPKSLTPDRPAWTASRQPPQPASAPAPTKDVTRGCQPRPFQRVFQNI